MRHSSWYWSCWWCHNIPFTFRAGTIEIQLVDQIMSSLKLTGLITWSLVQDYHTIAYLDCNKGLFPVPARCAYGSVLLSALEFMQCWPLADTVHQLCTDAKRLCVHAWHYIRMIRSNSCIFDNSINTLPMFGKQWLSIIKLWCFADKHQAVQ